MIIWGANSFQFINFSSVKLTWTSSWSSNAVQSRHKKYNAPHCLQIRAWPLTGQNYSPYQRELVMMLFINQSWLENLFTAVKLEQWTTIWRLAHILGHRNGTGRADLLRLIFGAACHFPFFFLFCFHSFGWKTQPCTVIAQQLAFTSVGWNWMPRMFCESCCVRFNSLCAHRLLHRLKDDSRKSNFLSCKLN